MKIQTKRTAATNPQFATGPQKCVVFGPVGEFTQRANAEDIIFCVLRVFVLGGLIKKSVVRHKKKAVREFDFLRVSRVDFSLSLRQNTNDKHDARSFFCFFGERRRRGKRTNEDEYVCDNRKRVRE